VARSIRLRLLHEHATASFGASVRLATSSLVALRRLWREEVHETKPMTRTCGKCERSQTSVLKNSKNCSSQDEVMAVGFEADAALGQSEIAE